MAAIAVGGRWLFLGLFLFLPSDTHHYFRTIYLACDPLFGHHRRLASSQVITLYDVVKLRTYFGISFEASLYRLRNLKFLSEEAFDQLYQLKEAAKLIAHHLKIAEKDQCQPK